MIFFYSLWEKIMFSFLQLKLADFVLVRSLPAMSFRLRFVPAESAGQREVGGCTRRVQTAWLLLGLAVERP